MEVLFVFFVIFIIAFALVSNSGNKNKKNRNSNNVYQQNYPKPIPHGQKFDYNQPLPEHMIKNNIVKDNPNFSEDNFKRYVEMVYVRYLASIMQRDAENVKKYLHKQMYETHKNYIDTIRLAGRRIHIENIIVNNITLTEHKRVNNVETIRVHVKSKMNQYETDNNGFVISGYRSRIVSKDDVLTFQRDHNQLYDGDAIKCPNCMASLPSVATKCQYCGTIVKYDDKTNDGWCLCDITTL